MEESRMIAIGLLLGYLALGFAQSGWKESAGFCQDCSKSTLQGSDKDKLEILNNYNKNSCRAKCAKDGVRGCGFMPPSTCILYKVDISGGDGHRGGTCWYPTSSCSWLKEWKESAGFCQDCSRSTLQASDKDKLEVLHNLNKWFCQAKCAKGGVLGCGFMPPSTCILYKVGISGGDGHRGGTCWYPTSSCLLKDSDDYWMNQFF